MVGSTVYGFENELYQIVALLHSMGYEVLNSHVGTIKVNPNLPNLENCLNAVDECDIFLGIIRTHYGTGIIGDKNIAFEEIKRAMEQRKPYWFMVHRDVVFARKLFGKIKGADKIEIHRNDFFDKRCLDVYEYVIKTGTALSERRGNWAQEFYSINDIFTFINTQFGDKNFVKLCNSLISNDNADIKTGFLQTTKDYYDTDVLRFDFASSDELKKLNNKYVDFTNNDPVFKSLDTKQSVISLSASDICDKWLNAYAQTDLEKGKFKSDDGEKEVTYMTSNETYMKTNKAQAVMKYFSQTPLKMMIIMPNKDISLDDYATDFTNLEYTTLLDSVDVTKTAKAKIPEFSIDAGTAANDITSVVEKSGVNSAFTADRSSYKNLSRSDDIAFSAMYDVTPSLSINAGGIGGTQSNGDKAELEKRTKELSKTDVTVEFNRPFMFVILDNESNIPLYMGTYTG